MRTGTRENLGPKFSEGARQMWLRCRARGWSMADLSRVLSWPRNVAYRYAWGDRKPEIEALVKIRDVLGIEPADFASPPKRHFKPPPPPARAA